MAFVLESRRSVDDQEEEQGGEEMRHASTKGPQGSFERCAVVCCLSCPFALVPCRTFDCCLVWWSFWTTVKVLRLSVWWNESRRGVSLLSPFGRANRGFHQQGRDKQRIDQGADNCDRAQSSNKKRIILHGGSISRRVGPGFEAILCLVFPAWEMCGVCDGAL